ncbi:MAG: uracil-DNA glycosylase, partial [Bdellovibrionia bacterium]
QALIDRITQCEQCERLRNYCSQVAQTKRRAYLSQSYWGKPVAGFGDWAAELVIVGLAPAAHGANRTGRVFTGDRSGEWLYRALAQFGFSNQPESLGRDDGLELKNAFVTCVVKCAPPGNRPLPQEQKNCSVFLKQELEALSSARVFLALGQYSYDTLWPHLTPVEFEKKPKFTHGLKLPLAQNRWLLTSFHPSQQNTFTGKLTQPLFDSVFQTASQLLSS